MVLKVGFKIELGNQNSRSFDDFTDKILENCEDMETKVLEELKKEAPSIVKKELMKVQRRGKLPPGRTKHMHADVKATIAKDKWGYKELKIKGGKQTGSLWHIVNDGTYKSKATHFIDKSMDAIDNITNDVINAVMEEESKKQ